MPISSTMVIRTRCHTIGAALHDYRPGRLYGSAGPSRLRRYVDEWNAEPDSKAVGDVAADAAVRDEDRVEEDDELPWKSPAQRGHGHVAGGRWK